MNIKKGLLIVLILGLSYWLLNSYKELRYLMKEYPEPFITLNQDFSLIRFYNTYQTISYIDWMIKRNSVSSRTCDYLSFDLPKDQHLIKPASDAYYLYRKGRASDLSYTMVHEFNPIGAACTSTAKLINFKYKDNEAHATFSCEREEFIHEFTYSSSNGGKCGVIQYKSDWGIKPIERTLDYTTSLIVF